MKLTDKLPQDATLKAILIQLRKLKKNEKILNDIFSPKTYNEPEQTSKQ